MNINHKILAIVSTILIVFIVGGLSIYGLGEYGLVVFLFVPFLIGFLPPYIIGRQAPITKSEAYSLSFLTLGLSCLLMLVFAMEGMICIIMASPILALLTLLGAYTSYKITSSKWNNPTNTTFLLALTAIGLMSFDAIKEAVLIPVKTQVVVDAPIEAVWENVVTFNTIAEPTDWLFKTGISYPTDATIKGTGVGAIRYCNFTTGSFVEPITTWNEPTLLQFDVAEQPIPMDEFNPFWNIHPPHLDGYFQSQKGQFALTKISANQTSLEGTTWYKVDITPEWYWKTWSDFILHRIHQRVLNHIKKETENPKHEQ